MGEQPFTQVFTKTLEVLGLKECGSEKVRLSSSLRFQQLPKAEEHTQTMGLWAARPLMALNWVRAALLDLSKAATL